MRLDQTRIAIIERRQPEILDAALMVVRKFFLPVVGLTLLLGIPFSFLNHWLVSWMADDMTEIASKARYVWAICLLTYVEAPLASALTTSYIGKAMFYEESTLLELLRRVAGLGLRLFWVHGIQRGVVIVVLLFAVTIASEEPTFAELSLPFICLPIFLLRSLRPYINEILLLELSPLRTVAGEVSAGTRSQRLHGPHSGDLFGRSIGMILVTTGLGFTIVGVLWFCMATLTNDWNWHYPMTHFALPLALWMLVAYVTVFRFLSYLDLRIRLEGWEVELKIRAEANRLTERLRLGDA